MADWEADNYVADLLVETVVVHDKWEGEDQEDEDIKDNWDDEEDEEEDETAEKEQAIRVAPKASEKKRLIDKTMKEIKLKKKQEEVTSQVRQGNLTADEQLAERLRVQKLQEETDLEIAKETFGVCVGTPDHATGLDTMCPSSKDEFAEFEKLLKEKMTQSERSAHYPGFLDSLFRELCISLDVEGLKRISNSLSALLSEKQKLEKQNKGKTKKKKGVIAGGGLKAKMRDEMDGFDGTGDSYAQEYEDFM